MRTYNNYSSEDIIFHAKQVKSIAGLLKAVGLKPSGGNYAAIKCKIQDLNIDTSHWTGQAWNKDQQQKDWSSYAKTGSVKPHLIKLYGHKCQCCSLEQWSGLPIPLELHHIDGNRTNNHLENLQILCPNCHAITDNWRGRNRKHETSPLIIKQIEELTSLAIDIIPQCQTYKEVCARLNIKMGGVFYKSIRKELDCKGVKLKGSPKISRPYKSHKIVTTSMRRERGIRGSKPKSNWYPTDQELFTTVWNTSIFKLGKKYGVTGNSIKRRCQRRNIPVPPLGYWAKLQAGKVEECAIIYAAAQKSFQDALQHDPGVL